MSQISNYGSGGTPIPPGTFVQTLTGNTGGPITPTAGGDIQITGSGNILVSGTLATHNLNVTFSGVLPIANGGTAASSYTTPFGTLYYNGLDFNTTATGAINQVLMSNGPGVAPTYQNLSAGGAVTSVNAGNSISITGTATAPIVNVAGTVNHAVQLGNATGSLSSLANGTTGQTLHAITGANDPIWSAVSLTADVTGTLPVANGGTGNTTFTPFSVITAGTTATGPFQNVVGVGTAGQVLVSGGPATLPVWTTVATGVSSVTGTANQITASPTTGVVILSTPATFIAPGSIASTTTTTAATGLIATAGGITATGNSAINTSGTGTNAIGTGTNTGTISIGNTSSGLVTIDAGTAGITVGTTANAHTSTFGSTNSTSATTVQSGSGALALTSTNGTWTGNSGTGALGLSTDATNTTISFGTGAGIKAVTIGSATSTSSTSIRFGGSTGSTLSTYIASTAFTPVLRFGGASVGITYSIQQGTYVQIGDTITFTLTVRLTSKGTSTGNASVVGLPVNFANSTAFAIGPVIITFGTGLLNAQGVAGSTAINLITSASAGANTVLTDTAFGATSGFNISGSYLI